MRDTSCTLRLITSEGLCGVEGVVFCDAFFRGGWGIACEVANPKTGPGDGEATVPVVAN